MKLQQWRPRTRRFARRLLQRTGYEVLPLESNRFMSTPPASTARDLPVDPRLAELRSAYASVDNEAIRHSYWSTDRIGRLVDAANFRGHSMYLWQYVDRPAVTELKYFVYLAYLERKDHAGLLDIITEDGAFGAPVFTFPGRPPVSRDVLDSVNEILYLDRQLGILGAEQLRVLDIGAGYGRLAFRMTEAVPGLVDYTCVDAVPESTFVCEKYLAFREVRPPCRVVALPDAPSAIGGASFDVAVNIHSFSEMSTAAVEYWVGLLSDSGTAALLVVPNAPTALLSHEADGSTRDLLPVLRAGGYELDHREPTVADPAARALFGVEDHFHLFRR